MIPQISGRSQGATHNPLRMLNFLSVTLGSLGTRTPEGPCSACANWARRLVRGSDTGWRAAQTSNAYRLFDAPRLSLPHRLLKTRFTGRAACASQQRPAPPIATSAEIAAAREALERRRHTVEAAMHAATTVHRDARQPVRLT